MCQPDSESPRISVHPALLWTYGLPVALVNRLRAFIWRFPHVPARQVLFLWLTAGVGALGWWLATQTDRSRYARVLWLPAWLLCVAMGFCWAAVIFGMRGLPLIPLAPILLAALLRHAYHAHGPGWRYTLTTGGVGRLGYRLFFGGAPLGVWRWTWPVRRLPRRAAGLVLLAAGFVWFFPLGLLCYALLEPGRRQIPSAAVWLVRRTRQALTHPAFRAWWRPLPEGLLPPVLLQRLLRTLCLVAAREAGRTPLFFLLTAGLGPLSLWMTDRPRRWWVRIPLAVLSLPVATAGLAFLGYTGWKALILVPLLRQFRHFPVSPAAGEDLSRPLWFRLGGLDWVSLAVVGAVLLVMLASWPTLAPFAPDSYYHLLVAQRIVDTGQVPLWDDWEYAPLGRPHLYAPLLHALIAVFSLPFGGDVVLGLRVIQVFLLPLALLGTWWLVRWAYGAERALAVLLVLGMDFMFAMFGMMALPSLLANAMQPFLFLALLSRRWAVASCLLAVVLYLHPGVGSLTVLGLVLFALWDRRYRYFTLSMIAAGVLLALPWYGHVYAWREWMGHPMRGIQTGLEAQLFKLFWLMNVNLFILTLAFVGLRRVRWGDATTRLVICMLVGFLPMLIEYGGRYFVHTTQWWVFLAAAPVAPLLLRTDRRKVVAALLFVACLVPTAILGGFGQGPGAPRYQPMPSAFVTMPVVAAVGLKDGHNYADASLLEAAAYIEQSTTPDTILHVGGDASLGVMLAYHARRRIDSAAWPEVRSADHMRLLEHYAATTNRGCYVSRDAAKIPAELEAAEVGGLFIALPAATP